jgi:hypothetical protein
MPFLFKVVQSSMGANWTADRLSTLSDRLGYGATVVLWKN